MMRTTVAKLLINSVFFVYFIGLSSQSPMDLGASTSGTKSPRTSNSGSKHLRTSSSGSERSLSSSYGSERSLSSISGSERSLTSSYGSERSLTSSYGSERSLTSISAPQLPPEINRKGLHIPDGVEVWWEKDKIIAMDENDVYRPFLFFAKFAIIQAVRNPNNPSKIGFNVVTLSKDRWLNYMAAYAEYNQRPSILYSARKTAIEYTKAKREALDELRREKERENAFLKLHEYDKSQGWHGRPE